MNDFYSFLRNTLASDQPFGPSNNQPTPSPHPTPSGTPTAVSTPEPGYIGPDADKYYQGRANYYSSRAANTPPPTGTPTADSPELALLVLAQAVAAMQRRRRESSPFSPDMIKGLFGGT